MLHQTTTMTDLNVFEILTHLLFEMQIETVTNSVAHLGLVVNYTRPPRYL